MLSRVRGARLLSKHIHSTRPDRLFSSSSRDFNSVGLFKCSSGGHKVYTPYSQQISPFHTKSFSLQHQNISGEKIEKSTTETKTDEQTNTVKSENVEQANTNINADATNKNDSDNTAKTTAANENQTTPQADPTKPTDKMMILAKRILDNFREGNPNSSERLIALKKSTIKFVKKIPGYLWSAVSWLAKYTFIFVRNPSIAKDWYQSAKDVVKHEAKHYWAGTKLFAADVSTAARLCKKIFQGNSLTRRERNQLLRTISDIYRLVPFLVIVVIPFMEFLLPVLIKVFPNLLPSQFEGKLQKEDKLRRTLRARLELAKFLQDTLSLQANELKNSESAETVATAEELENFIEAVRRGEIVNNEDIIRFAKLFNNEITLDNVSRAQLVGMCRYMNIQPYGTDKFLRFKLKSKLRQLKTDDRLLHWETVKSLSMDELVYACQSRGIRVGSKSEMRKGLDDWLQLSLDKNVPGSLLIMSRALTYTSGAVDSDEAIKMALSSLPDDVIEEVSLSAPSKDTSDVNTRKYESLKRHEKLIQEESKKKKKEEKQEASANATAAVALDFEPTTLGTSEDALLLQQQQQHLQISNAESVDREENTLVPVTAAPPTAADMVDAEEHSHEKEELMSNINKVIAVLAAESSVEHEKRELKDLINEHYATIGQTAEFNKESINKLDRLNSIVSELIDKLDLDIDKVDTKIGKSFKILDKDNDGQISVVELVEALQTLKIKLDGDMLQQVIDSLDKDNDGKISLSELTSSIKKARLYRDL
ncbi:LETM1 and EF-hand domain-containing protein 1, mitochondrial [Acrasis kona]|uniref:Mitochondrial proton/calcium exchanger protein n=1 Tax=Acrasis kona TaxID=1008807 RepID=A0AAW2Z5S6_9EUKA